MKDASLILVHRSPKSGNRPTGESMYYEEEERDMVIAKLLFYGIICIIILAGLITAATIIL
jgi:hypothetical protein